MSGKKRTICMKYYCSLFFVILLLMSSAGTMASDAEIKSKEQFCDSVNGKFREFGWDKITCNPDRWETYDYSSRGNPLLYQEFGFEHSDREGSVNLVLCGVHGDEPSAVYQCFHLVRDIVYDNPRSAENFKLVVAPLVNPDGFFLNTRQNANGVDPNRNLPTKDWTDKAHTLWARKKDLRKYPGKTAGSEAETRLQAYLINKYRPDKILSFHAPLGFLDFDGPGDRKYGDLLPVERRAKRVGLKIQKNTKRFLKFIDFRFYPGSLGNYAGNERQIPTYTVELPSTHASKGYAYWNIMRNALINALTYEIYSGDDINSVLMSQNTHSNVSVVKYRLPDSLQSDAGAGKDVLR